MIFEISKQEERRAKALYESYAKLIADLDTKISELRPDEPLPEDPKDFDKWLKSGSKEWREAREKRVELIRTQSESLYEYYQKLYDEHFKKIGDDPEAIVTSAFAEIDAYITNTYRSYENTRITGKRPDGEPVSTFRAGDVRATETGFLLDEEETVKRLLSVVSRHLQKLKNDKKSTKLINDYLVKAVAESPYITSTDGELFGEVPVVHETTEESSEYLVIRPTKYMTTVDRVSKLAFDNKLTKPVDADPEALWEVSLEPRKSKNEVIARVAIDYAELLKSGDLSELPEFTSDDYSVLDAIISLRNAGNYAFTKTMLYRVITGKVKGNLEVPPDMSEIIDNALGKFKGIFNLEYTKTDKNGNELTLRLKEPIVTYIIGDGYINGKYVDELIITPRDEAFTPPFEKWARFNGNEIDTRDITLLDVPRLNNGKESRDIKMCLYRRLISMRNTFERVKKSKYELADNQRTIRYDYVYDAIGVSDPDKNKRRLLKDKIDRCMKYWQKKGLIAGYEHKKDKSSGNQYYAVMVSFLEKE